MEEHFDIVIVGAGPAGLALAHCCSNANKRVLVIEKESTIGGCHRVKRMHGGLFTEHGPRIYMKNYVNFFHLLSEIGLNHEKLFTNYKYEMNDSVKNFRTSDLLPFITAYLFYLLNNEYGHNTSLVKFCQDNKLSNKSVDILSRLCRIIDGADIKSYSLGKILKILDTSSQILQPTAPMDILIFDKWETYLQRKGVVFALKQDLTYIHYCKNRRRIEYIVLNNKKTIYCNKLILAIPPAAMVPLLRKMNNPIVQNCFGDLHQLNEWKEETEYIEYISVTYHFKGCTRIPLVQGTTLDTDWGILAMNLSDYMKEIETGYDKVLSTAITICDKPSRYIHKTANECNEKEIYEEVYRQLNTSIYPNLPKNYVAVMNPNNYYDKLEHKWKTTDEAYFNTIGTKYLPNQSITIPNMYNVGTQNGHSHLAYTTLESAVSNGMALACKLYPELKMKYYLRRSWRISEIIYLFILSVITLMLCLIGYMHIQN